MHIFDYVGVAAAELYKPGVETGSLAYEVRVITITPHSFLKNTDAVKLIKVNMSLRVLG